MEGSPTGLGPLKRARELGLKPAAEASAAAPPPRDREAPRGGAYQGLNTLRQRSGTLPQGDSTGPAGTTRVTQSHATVCLPFISLSTSPTPRVWV